MCQHTVVIRAHFESLVSTHDQSCLAALLVLEQSDIAGATFFPFIRFADELEKLCAHLEGLLFCLLVGLDFDFLGEPNNRLKVDIF